MKRYHIIVPLLIITALSLLLTSCATTLPPAEPSAKEMKQADTLILEVDSEPDEAYRQIAQFLNDKGFTLSNTDETLRTITTDFKSNEGFKNYDYKISASVREKEGTNIILKATVKSTDMISGGMKTHEAENSSMSSNFDHKVWDRLKNLADEFGYKSLKFERS
jgi:uncharacterized lipoprotein